MYRPIIRINELKKFLIRFRMIETALDAVILFLSLFLILSYAGVNSLWALVVAPVLFFLIALRYRAAGNMIHLIENRYPSLRERLGALYDSREEKNEVVEDLAGLVDSEMEHMKYSSFISTGLLGIRAAVIIFLVAFLLSSSLVDIPGVTRQTSGIAGIQEKTGSSAAQDIFGEPSVVKIGNDSQGILLYRGEGYELNVKGEGKPVSGYSALFPPEASSSGTYAEAIPVVYQIIVKNYFTNISLQD